MASSARESDDRSGAGVDLDSLAARLAQPRPGGDRYGWIRQATDAHRAAHGCGAYPFEDGPLLGAVVEQVRPSRVLELGAALGYTAAWLACVGQTHVDTVDRDPAHAELARANLREVGVGERVHVLEGDFAEVLSTLTPGYDLAFFDGYAPTPADLANFARLLVHGGVLVSANLELGDGSYRRGLTSDPEWSTRFVGETAISLRR